jgi:uncharacterized protein with gpF-like domain
MPIIIKGDPPKRRKAVKKGQAIRSQKAAEMEMRRALVELNRELKRATALIAAQVSAGASPLEVSSLIERMIRQANQRFDSVADRIAFNFVSRIDADNKARVERMLQNALGVDIVSVLDNEAVSKELEIAIADNTRLIKTIPEEHFKKVAQAVYGNYRGESFPEGSLANRLKKLGSITDRRAKFIARDQTQKLVTSLNAVRQKEAGVDRYIWRNQGDNRVVGKPGGLYPEGNKKHMDHWHREGKIYKWSDPPADGHPGQPIGCRCFAEPIVDIEKIEKKAIKI